MDQFKGTGGVGGPLPCETLIKPILREGLSEESLCVEEGASSNGEDIMVEVLGSDVFVDGVCARGGGDGVNSHDDVDHDAFAGREIKSVQGLSHEVENFGSRGIGGSTSGHNCGTGSDGSIKIVGSIARPNEVVTVKKEVAVVIGKEDSEGGKMDEVLKGGFVKEEVKVWGSALANRKIENGGKCSSAVVGYFPEGNEFAVMDSEQGLGAASSDYVSEVHGDLVDVDEAIEHLKKLQRVVAFGPDASEELVSGSGRNPIDGTWMEKDYICNSISISLNKQTNVDVGGEVSVMVKGKNECFRLQAMDSKSYNDTSDCLVDNKQLNVEKINGITQKRSNVYEAPVSSCQPLRSEVAAIDEKILSSSHKSEEVQLGECLDKSANHDLVQVDSSNAENKVLEGVTHVENVSFHDEQHLKISASVDEHLSGSGSDQNPKAKIKCEAKKISKQANERGEMDNKDYDEDTSAERVQVLTDVCLEKKMSSDLSLATSNAAKKHTADAQLVLQKITVEEQIVNTEVSASSGKQAVAGPIILMNQVDQADIALMESEEILNYDIELQGHPGNYQHFKLEDSLVKSEAPYHHEFYQGLDVVDEDQTTDTEMFDIRDLQLEDEVTDVAEYSLFEERDAIQVVVESSIRLYQARYHLAQEIEGEFSVSDLVWGKVKSHLWWPGQIVDPSDSSEMVMKYQSKDSFLVAYFGDHSLAWNEASLLRPFRTHFSQIEKQSNSEEFQSAVDCALEEVTKQVEWGLTCSCITRDVYDKIEFQVVENTGIRQDSSRRREVVDNSVNACSFEPIKLLEYIKTLAQLPSSGADIMDLVIAKAQLTALSRLKGFIKLPEFQLCGWLLENDADEKVHMGEYPNEQVPLGRETSVPQRHSSHKRKHNLKDITHSRKKRSLSDSEPMDYLDGANGPDGIASSKLVSSFSSNKCTAVGSAMQVGAKRVSFATVSNTAPPFPKSSFGIGDSMCRVASQLNRSPSILKCNHDRLQRQDAFDISFEDPVEADSGNAHVPSEYLSLDDLLSQLRLSAQDPMGGCSFLNVFISFFSDFKNSIKRSSQSTGRSPKTFEFEDMNDSYWTDMIVQNGAEEQLPHNNTPRGLQFEPVILEKPLQASRRSYTRKQSYDGNLELVAEKTTCTVKDKRQELSPAELIMNFPELYSVPSEMNLNNMFRRFGPLKESATEIDRLTYRARVVFKRGSDAEVAYSSAGKFNIFGPIHVSYQLRYSPSIFSNASFIPIPEQQEAAT